MKCSVALPHVLAIDEPRAVGSVQQIVLPAKTIGATLANYTTPKVRGHLLRPDDDSHGDILVVGKARDLADSFPHVLVAKVSGEPQPDKVVDFSGAAWHRHREEADVLLDAGEHSVAGAAQADGVVRLRRSRRLRRACRLPGVRRCGW